MRTRRAPPVCRRRVMVLIVVTCLLLITLDKRGNPIIDGLRSVFDRITQPVDTATNALVLPLERAWYGITNYEDLEDENARLRDQLEQVRGSQDSNKTVLISKIKTLFPSKSPAKYKLIK